MALTASHPLPTLGTLPCPDSPMPFPPMRRLALLALAALISGPVLAQTEPTPVQTAEAEYQSGHAAEAVARLERYLDGRDDAEGQYLLARILYADGSPVQDTRRAARAIDRAVGLDPDNVVYLVAQLEGQRLGRVNILLDFIRARRRYVIAQHILALDPDNAYAHEELGTWAIRDYYQYRNAIAFPRLEAFAGPQGGRETFRLDRSSEDANTQTTPDGGQVGLGVDVAQAAPQDAFQFDDQDAAYGSDRFDVELLTQQGSGIVTFAERAQRAYDEATLHLRAALREDPRRRPVYDHIVRLAAISGRWADAAPDLREMFVQFPSDAQMWLYVGLAAQRTGQYETADASFREALARMTPDTLAAFTDLSLILPPDEVPAYLADRDAFTQRYWTSRDPRFLNAVNERRSEHYARLTEADLLFHSDALDRPGWKTERGLLYVRYGPPDSDVMIDGSFAQIVESYPDLEESFGLRDSRGEVVVQQRVGASAAERSANRFNVWHYPGIDGAEGLRLVFEDPNRTGQFRLYSPPAYAYALRSARGGDRMDFVLRARDAVRETPERYTFAPPGRAVDLPYRVTAFKGEGARTDLYVNYGVPLAPGAGDANVTIQTGAFLVGASRDLLVERRRTVYGLRAPPNVQVAATRLWTTSERLEAPPGRNEVSVEFETAGGGASAVQRRAVDVPDFQQPGLRLSDVMLAYAVDPSGAAAPGRVVRGGVALLPAPWGVFEAGAPVIVYVEPYGLTLRDGRTDFEVTAELTPRDASTGLRRLGRRILGRRQSGVASTLEAEGSTPDDTQDLRLSTEGQAPGLYTLTVTVRDRVSGATAERETDLLLEAPPAP